MMAPSIPCTTPQCQFSTPAQPSSEAAMQILYLHRQDVHQLEPPPHPAQQQIPSNTARVEKPTRPAVTAGMNESDWNFFLHEWGRYSRQTGIKEAVLRDELWSCMETELRQLAFSEGFRATTENDLLQQIKNLAVTVLHPSVHVIALHNMTQQEGETIKSFAARVKGTAGNCNLLKTCTKADCTEKVSFMEETVYHVVMSGISDKDLREKVLTQAMLTNVKDLPTLLNYVTAEESARVTTGVHDLSNISGLRRRGVGPDKPNLSPRVKKCGHCGQPQHGDKNKDRATKCKAYDKECSNCKKMHHFAAQCRSAKAAAVNTDQQSDTTVITGGMTSFMARISTMHITSPASSKSLIQAVSQNTVGSVTTLPLPHYVYSTTETCWKQNKPRDSPTLSVSLRLDKAAYGELKLCPPRLVKRPGAGHARAQRAITDTGAQLTVINISMLHTLGIKTNSIFSVATQLSTVTRASVDLVGGVFLIISAANKETGETRQTRQLCYVSKSVPATYLSDEACEALGCIPPSFPSVAAHDEAQQHRGGHPQVGAAHSDISAANLPSCTNTGVVGPHDVPCKCPKRSLPPTDKPVLPCAPTVENLPIIKQYILERFHSSAFNKCEKQPLPLMENAPPLRLFVDPTATPVAVTSPGTIPHHWATDVKAGLDRDERLGVIKKVSVNEPLEWCARMVVTAKTDGSPRRTVDYGNLNKNCPRQTHHTKAPWVIASSIPGGKIKTVLDNWNGYHSVPIHPADRKYTVFLTPYGRYEYLTTPQGLVCAGDGYTQRMDLIVGDLPNSERCVDDTVIWDDDIESNFFRVCSFLTKCSLAGCVFNGSKFQFAQTTVDFLGFQITDTGVQPHPDTLDTIRKFPRPQNISDIRAWFGLVNQVSYSFSMASTMAPFRHLLSTKLPFYWSEELETAFDASKEEIIRQCIKGVRSFRLNAPTALATDWSKLAVGCWLTQKCCDCEGPPRPGCCPTGWQTVMIASHFCSPAQSRYHPIEGEAFASAWALEKCRMFVLGHPHLILAVDHKPLLATLGPDQDLSTILNPRLLNFKLKTMAYRFTPMFIPGKAHVVPDAMSRRHDSPIADLPPYSAPPPTDNNVLPGYEDKFGPPTWVSSPSVPATASLMAIPDSKQQDTHTEEMEEMLLGQVISHLAGLTPLAEADIASFGAHNVSVITWDRLVEQCKQSSTYQLLHNAVTQGLPDSSKEWDSRLLPYHRSRHGLSTLGPVVLHYDRPVIPVALRQEVMDHLHAAHGCANSMFQRATTSVYWPGYRQDINRFQATCHTCRRIAPSNPAMPPSPSLDFPSYPFQSICTDFFTHAAKNYLIIVDRYTNWLSIARLAKDDSSHVIKILREYFSTYGICDTLSSDGASVYTSAEMAQFSARWGFTHRISSSYFPRSNKRAEVGVKSAKRMIQDNIAPNGDLDTDKLCRALLVHRNTPDPMTNISPAQLVFGRNIKDHIPAHPEHYTVCKEWKDMADMREDSAMVRHYKKVEDLTRGSKKLSPLIPGDQVYLQDQTGRTPKRWNKSGIILEVQPHDSYLVKVDGSKKVTKRNRQFLRKFEPFYSEPAAPVQPPPLPPLTQLARPPPLPVPSPPIPPPSSTQDTQPSPPTELPPPPEPPTALTSPPTPDTQPQIPKHLRERWIVNPKFLTPTNQPMDISPISSAPAYQHQPTHPVPAGPTPQVNNMSTNTYPTAPQANISPAPNPSIPAAPLPYYPHYQTPPLYQLYMTPTQFYPNHLPALPHLMHARQPQVQPAAGLIQ